eukprot:2684519-Pyramimonas_sp.AAC.1
MLNEHADTLQKHDTVLFGRLSQMQEIRRELALAQRAIHPKSPSTARSSATSTPRSSKSPRLTPPRRRML